MKHKKEDVSFYRPGVLKNTSLLVVKAVALASGLLFRSGESTRTMDRKEDRWLSRATKEEKSTGSPFL